MRNFWTVALAACGLASCAQPVFAQACQPVSDPADFISRSVAQMPELRGDSLIGPSAAAFGDEIGFDVRLTAAFVMPHEDDLVLVIMFQQDGGTTVVCIGAASERMREVVKKHFGRRA